MSQAVAAVTDQVIELSRRLAPHFPWEPRVGDTFFCAGMPRMVWNLPAPCHATDFRILTLYEAKAWLREHGVVDIETVQHGLDWKVSTSDPATGKPISSSGTSDVEAALRLVLIMLGGDSSPATVSNEPL